MLQSTEWKAVLVFVTAIAPVAALGQQPNVHDIIEKSVAANQADFKAAPHFNYKERDRLGKGSKTYQVTMIEGSPYSRLIAINDQPLASAQAAAEEKKQQQVSQQRRSESPEQRQARIQKYEKERRRDNAMMNQLTVAFNFTLLGRHKLRGFDVWALKATPKPGYQPPNMETQVLPGMQGELWIDQKSCQWVKVTARVIHPVSIEGFLARVEPGTQFELENAPVGNGIWQAAHFAMRSNAKVLYLFNHGSHQDETYFDYQPVSAPDH